MTFINNYWKAGTGAFFQSYNPATGEIVWEGHAAEAPEIDAAVIAARKAFQVWSSIPLEKRISYLEAFGDALRSHSERLAVAISSETGKPLWESQGEVSSMISKIPISIEAYAERCPERIRLQSTGSLITRHKPHGVIAVLGPFNFPGHLPNGHIIPALLAGNTVVFKPSELTPLTGEIVMQCWEQSHLPPGTINLVQGARETGVCLIRHAQIDGLFFTGSCESGLSFSQEFAKTPWKILALEMGGNNPLVVSQVNNFDAAALITIQSAYLTSGQRCSCARRLIVLQGKEGDHFLDTLEKMIDRIKIGPYTDSPEPFMGPVISKKAAQHLLAKQEHLKSMGGIFLKEMRLLKAESSFLSPGLMDVTSLTKHMDEEVFGPLLQVIRVKDMEAAILEANHTSFGLTAGLLSISSEEFKEFYKRIRAGIINWNAPLTGASSGAPFGGIGKSGNQRPSAYYTADYCAYPVATIESPLLKLPSSLPQGIVS